MRPTRLTGLAAIVVAAVLGVTACSASSPATTAPPQNAPAASAPATSGPTGGAPGASSAAPQVVITGFAYEVAGPVQPGATVSVRNDDNVAHTVTSDSQGMFDVTVPAHGTASFTAPQTAGSYALHCTFHPNMHGKLVVR